MTYTGRPALVAPYRRRGAPPSVHAVALFFYLAALVSLVAGAVAAALTLTDAHPPDGAMPVPDSVRRGLAGGGLVIAVALVVVATVWLVIARRLQLGAAWARVVVLLLSLLGVLGTGYAAWHARDIQVLAGLGPPLLYLLLLNTRAARSWFR
jgi:hypothetical protein